MKHYRPSPIIYSKKYAHVVVTLITQHILRRCAIARYKYCASHGIQKNAHVHRYLLPLPLTSTTMASPLPSPRCPSLHRAEGHASPRGGRVGVLLLAAMRQGGRVGIPSLASTRVGGRVGSPLRGEHCAAR